MSGYTLTAGITLNGNSLPFGGTYNSMKLIRKADILSITEDSTNSALITAITLVDTKVAFVCAAAKGGANEFGLRPRSEDKQAQALDGHAHVIEYDVPRKDSATMKFIRELMDDEVVAIVELKDEGLNGDGKYQIYGITHGLRAKVSTNATDSTNGMPLITLTTVENDNFVERYPYSVFYSTDLAATDTAYAAL